MARNYNKGRFFPRFPEKYIGNINNIEYRSSWEFHVMRWLDRNNFVKAWVSEEVVLPYICKTDGKTHRYYMDFYIEFYDGKKYIIEIKPFAETQAPVKKKQKQKTYLNSVFTYAKNVSKWEQARIYAKNKGYIFQIWTEKTLEKLGILN